MVELRLFGRFEATVDGHPLRRLRTQRGLTVLSLLGIRLGKPVDRNYIAETVWPDSEVGDALYSLRRTLTDLRQALGSEGKAIVSASLGTLSLDPTCVQVDIAEFERLLERDDLGAVDAANWYRGPLLEGWNDDWVVDRRAYYEQLLREGLLRAASALEAQERFSEAADALKKLLQHQPHDEQIVRQAMTLMERSGNSTGAYALYNAFRQRLTSELGLDVSANTSKVAGEIAQRASSPQDEPKKPVRGSIPAPPDAIVGREKELAEALRLIQDHSLVTLVGLGGIGKTRLSLEAARKLEETFPDGAWFVPLAAIRDPAEVMLAFAAAVRPMDPTPSDPVHTLPQRLSGRRFLLLLDNCEHLLEAARDLCATVRTHCPGLRVLATSQLPLGLEGEQVVRVPVLTVPGENEEASSDVDATKLFLRRAAEANPNLNLSEEERLAITSICRRLEGIPLAIELAAGRTKFLPPSRIDSLLAEKLDLLRIPVQARDPRHQTLDAALSWSFGLLDAEERNTLFNAATFFGTWALDDLFTLLKDESPDLAQCVGQVETLVDRSLIVEAGDRFRLLEPVRQFVWSHVCTEGRESLLRERHLHFVIDRCVEYYERPPVQRNAELIQRMNRITDEISGALAWTERMGDARSALRITGTTWGYYWNEGLFAIGRNRTERALAIPGATEFKSEFARALMAAGSAAWSMAEYELSEERVRQALALFEEFGDHDGQLYALLTLAISVQNQGRSFEALEYARRCQSLFDKEVRLPLKASAMSCYALALFEVQRNEEAMAAFDEALRFAEENDLPGNRVTASLNKGQLLHALGCYDEAYACFAEARSQADARRMAVMRIMAGFYRSMLDIDLERDQDAIDTLCEGLELFVKMGERRGAAMHAEVIALIALTRDAGADAARLLGFAQGLRDSIPAHRCPAHEVWFRRQLSRSKNEDILTESVDVEAGRSLSFSTGVELARKLGQALARALGVDCTSK